MRSESVRLTLHLAALERLGAAFSCEGEAITAEGNRLHCGTIRLGLPSVGATENSILAAVLLPGETRIEHAAQEPEIDELIRFLNLRGGKLQRMGDAIVIEGGRCLHPVRFRIASDPDCGWDLSVCGSSCGRRTAFAKLCGRSDACRSAIADGRNMSGRPSWRHVFSDEASSQSATRDPDGSLSGISDRSAVAIDAVCARADGQSRIWETVFESRFRTAQELQKMGAEIFVQGNLATIKGKARLHAASLRAPDLRGGAALVVAALFAEGISEISGLEYISRGYEDIGADLCLLGANIRRHESETR